MSSEASKLRSELLKYQEEIRNDLVSLHSEIRDKDQYIKQIEYVPRPSFWTRFKRWW